MEHTTPSTHPWRSSTAFIVSTVAFAVFTDAFVYDAIVPIMPSAFEREGFHENDVAKLITTMLAVFGFACFASSAPSGWWSDRHLKRRTPFLIGLVVLIVATVLLWVGAFLPHRAIIGVQIAGRALQGMASAIVWTTALAVLVDTVGQNRIGEYSGYIGIALNFGTVAGPLLGGLLYNLSGYNGVFGLVMAILVVDIILRALMKETAVRAHPEPIVVGAKGPTVDLRSIASSSSSTTATVSTRSYQEPTRIPTVLRLLGSSRFCVNLWGAFVMAVVFTSFDTTLPLHVDHAFHWTALRAGMIFLPLSVPCLFGTFVGKLTDRFGGRWFVFAALLGILCPCLICLRFVSHDDRGDIALLVILLFLVGVGLMVILEPVFSEIARRSLELQQHDLNAGRHVGHGYYAQAYAHFNMAWSLGNTIAPIMAGFIGDWKTTTLVLGLLCGASAFPMLLWSEGWLFAEGAERVEREHERSDEV